jgi:hypothetical protein
MAAVKVKTFIINNVSTTDSDIETGLGVTSTVFGISVIPISAQKSRVIVFYN